MANEPALNIIMNNVLTTLSGYLSPVAASLPSSTVSVVSATKKNPAIGNRIGTEKRGGYPTVAIKGGHLDASIQFQIWDLTPEDIEIEMNDLHGRLMADKDLLRNQGFITFKAKETATSEHVPSINAWRKTSQFNLLFEYQYQDSDDALSIITRIPVESDLEVKDSPEREISTVTNAIQRWDDEDTNALTVVANSDSKTKVLGLNILAHIPGGWLGDQIVIDRTNLDTVAVPTIYPTLNDFLDAVTDPSSPDENARITFASTADFIAALTADGAPFDLGDWDEDLVPDEYQAYEQIFQQPIYLPKANDVFRISYQNPPLNSKAVIYLRARLK